MPTRPPLNGTWRPVEGLKGRVLRYAWSCPCGQHTEYVQCSEGYKYGAGRQEWCPIHKGYAKLICERLVIDVAQEFDSRELTFKQIREMLGKGPSVIQKILAVELFAMRVKEDRNLYRVSEKGKRFLRSQAWKEASR